MYQVELRLIPAPWGPTLDLAEQRKGSIMQAVGKRVWVLLALGLLAVPVSAAGVAYACTALATVSTSSSSAVVGSTITVSGKYFAPHDASDIRTTPAIIHMDRVDGPALAQVSPSSASTSGAFSVPVAVPAVEAGDHVLIVTQNGIDGKPAYGTPARTILTVALAPVVAAAAPALTLPAPVAVPAALAAPIASPASPVKTKAQRMAACKSKYKLGSAKSKKARKRIAARRSACIRLA
jgi:hypothetical protein